MSEITSLQIGQNKIRLNRVIDYANPTVSNVFVDTVSQNGWFTGNFTCPDDGVVILYGSGTNVNFDIHYYIKDKATLMVMEQKHYKNAQDLSGMSSVLLSGQIQVHKGQVLEFGGLNIGNGYLRFYPYK